MPSKGSPDRSDDAAPAPDTTEWSANGVHADSAEVTDSPADDATSADAPEPTAEADADAELAPAEATDDVAAATDEDGSGFLNQLVRAMQTTAAAEKARVAAEIDRRREAHLSAVEARRLAEATTMLELADTDLKAIDSWAEAERHRIQAERERRATALQADLEASLADPRREDRRARSRPSRPRSPPIGSRSTRSSPAWTRRPIRSRSPATRANGPPSRRSTRSAARRSPRLRRPSPPTSLTPPRWPKRTRTPRRPTRPPQTPRHRSRRRRHPRPDSGRRDGAAQRVEAGRIVGCLERPAGDASRVGRRGGVRGRSGRPGGRR